MNVDWNKALFALVFVGIGALVYNGKLDPAVMVGLVAWLFPSPMNGGKHVDVKIGPVPVVAPANDVELRQ